MSRSWAKGSTRAWRRTRARVLYRDKGLCQLKLEPCTTAATCVHHVVGRAVSGDDERYLVASCRACNARVGEPGRRSPAPKRVSNW